MEENEQTVPGSQHGQDKINGGNLSQTLDHKSSDENPPEQIQDDRIMRFRSGIR